MCLFIALLNISLVLSSWYFPWKLSIIKMCLWLFAVSITTSLTCEIIKINQRSSGHVCLTKGGDFLFVFRKFIFCPKSGVFGGGGRDDWIRADSPVQFIYLLKLVDTAHVWATSNPPSQTMTKTPICLAMVTFSDALKTCSEAHLFIFIGLTLRRTVVWDFMSPLHCIKIKTCRYLIWLL